MTKKVKSFFPEESLMIQKLDDRMESLKSEEVPIYIQTIKYAIQALVMVHALDSADQLLDALKASKFPKIAGDMEVFQKEVEIILSTTERIKNLWYGDTFDQNLSIPIPYLNRIWLVGEDWFFYRKWGLKWARGHFGRNVKWRR